MKKIARRLSLMLVLAVVSCVTINIYFPAEEIRGAADKIVNEVWGNGPQNGADKMAPQPPEKAPDSGFYRLLQPNRAFAAQDINVSTPAIRTIKESIKNRSGQLIGFLDAGHIGIGHDGLLKIHSSDGLTLMQKGQINKLISAENQDRQRLYREIAAANDFPDKVDEVRDIFADSWRKQAKPGWYLEKPDGGWEQK